MKTNKNISQKTEILFESDADKILLKQAQKDIKSSPFKYLLPRFIIISILFSFFLYINALFYNNNLEKLRGSIINKSSMIPIELKNKISKSNNTLLNYDNDEKYLVIVNEKTIDEINLNSYKQEIIENNKYDNIILEKETSYYFSKLKKELQKRNYYINVTSGYFDSKNIKYISEHNLGIGFDFELSNNEKIITNTNNESYIYLKNISYLYGFIIRYPQGKEKITGYKYTPFHLRYVGVNAAKYIKKNNLTLEEYLK